MSEQTQDCGQADSLRYSAKNASRRGKYAQFSPPRARPMESEMRSSYAIRKRSESKNL